MLLDDETGSTCCTRYRLLVLVLAKPSVMYEAIASMTQHVSFKVLQL